MSELRSSYTSRPSLPEDFAERRELYDAGCKRLALLRMKTGGTPSADSSKSGRILYVNGKRVEVNEHSATDPNISKEGEGTASLRLRPSTTNPTNPTPTPPGADKARYSNWHGGNLDPESVSRHQRLLNRAGFRNNSDAIGNGGIF